MFIFRLRFRCRCRRGCLNPVDQKTAQEDDCVLAEIGISSSEEEVESTEEKEMI